MRWIWTRLDRARRRLGLDHNDLRRRIDRVQWGLATALLAIFLVAAPAIATVMAGRAYQAGLRAELREAATRHQVVATVVDQNARATPAPGGTNGTISPTVRVRWPAPDGSARTAEVPSQGPSVPGARVSVWLDDSGAVTTRPRRHVQTVGDAVYAAGGTVSVVGVVLLSAYGVLRRRCNRLRSRLWDADWARMDRRPTL
jgi:hypothetical protein